ncbi:hypothetical protein SAY87_008806 [Trapa incisa]|uniref:Gnk2-homologous domain-containing protein n=1 Tax=Trapa incisa TaxID=236973 RepID=A0AAN7JWM6_9MYRT|nr:hypothetical protein SAY87_008806 [Trapa incisa]
MANDLRSLVFLPPQFVLLLIFGPFLPEAQPKSIKWISRADEEMLFVVQCTPDLTELQCSNCLRDIIGEVTQACPDRCGGRTIAPSCNIRYEVYRFYDSSANTPSAPPSAPPPRPLPNATANSIGPPSNGGSSNTARIVIVIVVVSIAVVFLLAIIVFCVCRRRVEKPAYANVESMDEIRTAESLQCDFATIRDSTDNFSEENKLGQGGFGPVYKAWRNWREGTATSIVDPSLINNGPRTEILRCIHIGLLCVQENAVNRPTMASVLLMLNSFSTSLPVPSQPALYMHSNVETGRSLMAMNEARGTGSDESSSTFYEGTTYEASITDLYPR